MTLLEAIDEAECSEAECSEAECSEAECSEAECSEAECSEAGKLYLLLLVCYYSCTQSTVELPELYSIQKIMQLLMIFAV